VKEFLVSITLDKSLGRYFVEYQKRDSPVYSFSTSADLFTSLKRAKAKFPDSAHVANRFDVNSLYRFVTDIAGNGSKALIAVDNAGLRSVVDEAEHEFPFGKKDELLARLINDIKAHKSSAGIIVSRVISLMQTGKIQTTPKTQALLSHGDVFESSGELYVYIDEYPLYEKSTKTLDTDLNYIEVYLPDTAGVVQIDARKLPGLIQTFHLNISPKDLVSVT